jgi:branched-subunit amino acid transport protein
MTIMGTADRTADRWVLAIISAGLITIIMSIVWGLFLNPRTLPNWAENVLVSIASVTALKLGDCLATLVTLASGRQNERLVNHLASAPATAALPAPEIDTSDRADAATGKANDPVHITPES